MGFSASLWRAGAEVGTALYEVSDVVEDFTDDSEWKAFGLGLNSFPTVPVTLQGALWY